jgi:acylphosphatase
VQGEAQGTGDGIEGFVRELQRGPRMAVVERVERADVETVDGEEGFWVRA